MPKLEVVNANNVIEFNPQKANFKLKNTGGPKGDTGAQGPQGPKGETGAQGPAGASASVTVGSTTTLSPGADATVTNSGDTRNAILNFGIPTGARGPKGDTGSKGDTGPIGPKGAKGDTGAAATVQVGNTNTGAPGTNAQVTNAGNEHFAVFNFTIPRGDKGEKGATGAQGPKGPAGQDGTDGFSPIATVTQEGLDAEISITDKDGTTTATVPGFGVQVVESLPATGSSNVIYLERDSNSASGKSISISDAVEAPLKSLEIQGNTSQQTYTGKNLVYTSGKTDGGITATYNAATGKTTISGTAQRTYAVFGTVEDVLPAGTYTFSIQSAAPCAVGVATRDSGGTRQGHPISVGATKTTFTISEDSPRYDIYLTGLTANTAYNFTFKAMLESGSSATPFEPYVGGVPAPNPDYPQAVKTVTGENVVKICGKNLLEMPIESGSSNGITWTVQDDGSIILNGTSTAGVNIRANNVTIPAVEGETYTLSATGMGEAYNFGYKNSGSGANIFVVTSDSPITTAVVTSTMLSQANCLDMYIRSGKTFNNQRVTLQFEKGSTPTAYEPYQGQSYNISLVSASKNLFNKDKAENGYRIGSNGSQISDAAYFISDWIPVEPNTQYVISPSSYLTYSAIATYKADGTFLRRLTGSRFSSITTESNAAYIRFTTDVNSINTTQLEKGSTATSYVACQPIEMCKLGDYQDYIYKSGDKWYVHKEVGKATYNGSENWGYESQTYYLDGFNGKPYSSFDQNTPLAVSPHFRWGGGSAGTFNFGVFWYTLAGTRLRLEKDENPNNTTLASFKTWLGSNNLSVYYVLATPTDTEITNEALVAQLEAILAGGTQAGANTIALTPSAGATGTLEVEYYDSYDSYLWVNNRWEKFAHLG